MEARIAGVVRVLVQQLADGALVHLGATLVIVVDVPLLGVPLPARLLLILLLVLLALRVTMVVAVGGYLEYGVFKV